MSSTNPYRLLGVAEDASAEQISSAYRRLARQYHPDATGGDTRKAEHFKLLSAAHHDLKDPSRRSQVDARLRRERPHTLDRRRPVGSQTGPGRVPPRWSRWSAPTHRTGSRVSRGRTATEGKRPSSTPFIDMASKIAKSRPRSEHLVWIVTGAVADLLFAIPSKGRK
jgi:curved DNA-binding protein CbpA